MCPLPPNQSGPRLKVCVGERDRQSQSYSASPSRLTDDGVIDEVIRSLKSGKEATVYLVRSGAHPALREGVAGYGAASRRKEQEAAWKNAEVDALYKLFAAGVRVPKPYGYFNDTLIMELATDAASGRRPFRQSERCRRRSRTQCL